MKPNIAPEACLRGYIDFTGWESAAADAKIMTQIEAEDVESEK